MSINPLRSVTQRRATAAAVKADSSAWGLRLSNLTAGYGPHPIVFEIDAEFASAQVSAIVGPNGAGKSTVLKAMFGLAKTFHGDIYLHGQRMTGDARRLVEGGLAYVPQSGGVFPSLTVQDNLNIGGFVRSNVDVAEVLALFPELESLLKRPAGKLSGGQQRMVAIARALRAGPEILLLDESTSGLSPDASDKLWKRIRILADRGVAVVAVEQNVDHALEFSDEVLVLVSGRKIIHAPAESLTTESLASAFLGGAESNL